MIGRRESILGFACDQPYETAINARKHDARFDTPLSLIT